MSEGLFGFSPRLAIEQRSQFNLGKESKALFFLESQNWFSNRKGSFLPQKIWQGYTRQRIMALNLESAGYIPQLNAHMIKKFHISTIHVPDHTS